MQDPARWRGLVVFWVFGSRRRSRYYLNTQWTEGWWDQGDESENNGVRTFGVACPKQEKRVTRPVFVIKEGFLYMYIYFCWMDKTDERLVSDSSRQLAAGRRRGMFVHHCLFFMSLPLKF